MAPPSRGPLSPRARPGAHASPGSSIPCSPDPEAGLKPIRQLPFLAIQTALCVLAGCNAPTATRTSTGHLGGAALTAVFSSASKDYARRRNSDGTFQPETYLFGRGGNLGGPRVDETMDKLSMDDVSQVIAGALAAQNYVPSDDPAKTNLLIVVFWGVTLTPSDVMPNGTRPSDTLTERAGGSSTTAVGRTNSAAADSLARKDLLENADIFARGESSVGAHIDEQNARILGYPLTTTLMDEVEIDRYYVVLLAYDYQAARRFGVHKLLWETRFSISEPGNDFEKAFPMMASIAAKYFGQESHGLVHHDLGEGRVEVGEPKSLGPVPDQ